MMQARVIQPWAGCRTASKAVRQCHGLALSAATRNTDARAGIRLRSRAVHRTLHFTRSAQQLAQHPTQRDAEGRLVSRVSGPRFEPLLDETLGQMWKRIVAKHADRPALIVRHEPASQHEKNQIRSASREDTCLRWTYGDMEEHIQRLMHGLRAIGVQRGDRVAVLMMNSSAMASLQIATARVGAILVTLNPSYTPQELLRALNKVEASFLFIVPSLRSSNYLDTLKVILPTLQAASSRGDATLVHDEACLSLRRIILVDNLTNRPARWESECVLSVRDKATFASAMAAVHNRLVDYRDILQLRAGSQHAEDEPHISCRDIINLQLTSGTTGSPKAVALSSRNLVNNGVMLGNIMKLTPQDILVNVPPLFHCFGLTLGNLAAWSSGAAVVYAAEGFHPTRALRAAAEEGATALHGVPAHFVAELDVLRRVRQARKELESTLKDTAVASGAGSCNSATAWPTDLDVLPTEDWHFKLRTGFTSGSTVPIEQMRAIMDDELLGATEQTVVYGMTETSPVSFGCDTRADVEQRCKTVGRVVPHVEAKIVAPDDPAGMPLPVGAVGELCVSGYVIMEGGYWNDAERTREVLQEHSSEKGVTWMRTGDLGKMGEDGYTEICGRVKDLIIRGGENIAAVGIENCVDTLPGVAACAVVAVPDDRMGETVGVFIKCASWLSPDDAASKLSPPAVRAYIKKHLAGPCAPEWVWRLGDSSLNIPDAFPTTASGKVQKVALRQWARDLALRGVGHAKPRGAQPSALH